jgi:hypothetical protein
MTALSIRLGPNPIVPGGPLEGRIAWTLQQPPALTLTLHWLTRGKGTADTGQGPSTEILGRTARGEASFTLTAPLDPPSFSGRLISVVWQLTATDTRSGTIAVIEPVIAPNGREIRLA